MATFPIVAHPCHCLVVPSPIRPCNHDCRLRKQGEYPPPQQPPHLGYAQADESPRRALNAVRLPISAGSGPPFFSVSAASGSVARRTTSNACARQASVMCRCQAGPTPHFVVVQSDLSLGFLEAGLDRPAGTRHPRQRFLRRVVGSETQIRGQVGCPSTGRRFRYSYRVFFETPSSSQISRIGFSLASYRSYSHATFLSESIRGRPPFLPRALAATRPACVRSLMRLRSNSAIAPKIWKT